ncbi:hypothetical protein FHU36_007821 [Nonomuraea muscovyensis]|uniref:Uncharacterized protein n=1 Tax=Nonomuraea muscovyensis TaxID=1124761 RepID=A0A7X0C9V6_9ACTN|nr:hypothetical protein [Nonomuraea muscovyensis]
MHDVVEVNGLRFPTVRQASGQPSPMLTRNEKEVQSCAP